MDVRADGKSKETDARIMLTCQLQGHNPFVNKWLSKCGIILFRTHHGHWLHLKQLLNYV